MIWHSNQLKEILEISERHSIPVIEDCAHAHGSTLNNKRAGSFSNLGVFSFYPDKIMASSDGGIIVTNNRSYYEKLLLFRNVGRKKLGQDVFSEIGYNYRMNEIQAILALEQLRILPNMVKRRRTMASIYDSEFKGLKYLQIPKIPSNVKSSYYAYVMRLTRGDLSKFLQRLALRGIETSLIFISVYRHKAYENLFGKRIGLCPVSEKLDKETFTIPLHPGLFNNEINYVIKEIKKLAK